MVMWIVIRMAMFKMPEMRMDVKCWDGQGDGCSRWCSRSTLGYLVLL